MECSEEGSENLEITVLKYRQTLNRSFVNVCEELNEVNRDEKPYTPANFSKFIQCFRYCLEVFPQMFVPVSSEASDHVALAFTEWLIRRLLKVLSQPYSTIVHEDCENVFVSLLQVVRTSDPTLFRRFATSLLNLLSDFTSFSSSGCSESNPLLIASYFASQQGSPIKIEGLDLTATPIVISNLTRCVSLQIKILHLIQKLGSDYNLFLSDQHCFLWKLLCLQLENGSPPLKEASLLTISDFVAKFGLPKFSHLVSYFLDCVQALLNYVASSGEVALKLALAVCITNTTGSMPEVVNYGMTTDFVLCRFLEDLMQNVVLHGLKSGEGDSTLNCSVLKGIFILMRCVAERDTVLPFNVLSRFRSALSDNLDQIEFHADLYPVLIHMVSSEVNANNLRNGGRNPCTSPTDDEHSSPRCSNSDSLTWTAISEKLSTALRQAQPDSIEEARSIVTIVNCCLNILLKSCIASDSTSLTGFAMCKLSNSFDYSKTYLPVDTSSSVLRLNVMLCTTSYLQDSSIYDIVACICTCLVHFQDVLHLDQANYELLCGILSLNWVTSKTNWLDVRADSLTKKGLSYSAFNASSLEVKKRCLQSLSMLPANTAKLWRAFVLQTCLADNALRSAAITALPFYFFREVVTSHDVKLILKKVLDNNDEECCIALSNIVKILNCLLHKSCVSGRYVNGLDLPEIVCRICEQAQPLESNSEMDDDENDGSWITYVYLDLLEHSSAAVRKGSVSSLQALLVHNGLSCRLLSSVLKLMTDNDLAVRKSLCSVSKYLLTPSEGKTVSWNMEMEDILVKKLKMALGLAKSENGHALWETIFCTITEMGKVADHGTLLICMLSLLENILSFQPSVAAVARLSLKEIAGSKQYKMMELFKIYIEPVCKFLMESMLLYDTEDSALTVLEKISSIFGYTDLKSFLCITQKHLLPYLVQRKGNTASTMIKLLSRLLDVNRRDLLLNNFPFIFSHLVCYCKKDELERALIYIQKETELEFGSLLRCNYQHLHNELLLLLGSHYEQVFGGLTTLALKSEHSKKRSNSAFTREQMAEYLRPKLLGFLVFFDSQLLKSSITMHDKQLAVESLIVIMKLMGQRHITTVRFKLMATLRIALRFKDGNFPNVCCRAWSTFVHNLEMTSLGPLLNQIVVALLPLLESESDAVLEILHFLLIENKDALKEFFHELYFIPENSQLQVIHTVLNEYTGDPSSQSDFQTALNHSLKGVTHENLEVRLHALAMLKQVLTQNQTSLHEHLLGRESVDHLLSHFLAVVIPGCRESNKRARVLLGECLGKLGAIDPGRLEMNINSKKHYEVFLSSIDDDNFAFSVIQELARSFLAASDCRVQDCSAFAIQEALRIYKCSDQSSSSSSGSTTSQGNSGDLWTRFTPEVQEILQVLSNSQYKRLEKIKQCYPKPIYKSKVGSTFVNWVTNWFTHLSLKVMNDKARKLFNSCSMIIKYDLNCALFLLPHVALYSLLDSTDKQKDEITTEILAVLNDSEEASLPSNLCHLSSQSIFSIFDHLLKWTCNEQKKLVVTNSGKTIVTKPSEDSPISSIQRFLCKIPKLLLSKASYYCHAYTRSLMYLEEHIKENPSDLQNNISFLQKLYAALDEPDGVAGVAAIRSAEINLKDIILENEATGDMQAAFACYEKAINIYPDEVSYYGGLLKCFIRMDQPSTALTHANGILSNRPEWEEELNCYRIEAAWKLRSWKSLELFLKSESSSDKWNVDVGKLLFRINNQDLNGFQEEIRNIRCSQMAPLSAASMEKGAYLRGYEHLTRLHMLTDMEQSAHLLMSQEDSLDVSCYKNLLSEWNLRQQLVQSSLRYQEPMLDLHRILLNLFKVKHISLASKFNEEISSCWLKSAKLARKSGHHQRAYSCLLEASAMASPAVFMEKAKWFWNKGEKEEAINCLKKDIAEHMLKSPGIAKKQNDLDSVNPLAKAKLLLALYSEESSIIDSNRLIEMYQDIVKVQPEWEESHYHLAKYYDKVFSTITRYESKADTLVSIAKSFGISLHYGCKHVYHSLPRLLDIWFDMGTQFVEQAEHNKKPAAVKSLEVTLAQLTNTIIPEFWEKLPLHIFMTAFPQLISRICHSDTGIFSQLQVIIVKLLATYSQQAIWMMIAVSKSSYPMRVQRCKKIFQAAIYLKPDLGKFIQDTTSLADRLIELSNKNITDTNTVDLYQHFPNLPKLVENRNFSSIMIPLKSQMFVTLPSQHSSSQSHNPFPFTPICIQGFQKTVDIFSSLQRPKKIGIKGSDGKVYDILCKPKDDLRKDCRFMEFNNLVNRYLMSDPEARKRQLYIRTYAVVPLNEECGLIEWVQNLSGLRPIITRIYKNKGMFVSAREIKAMMPHRTSSNEEKLNIFKLKFLPRFPLVFSQWFLTTFPDPTSWYHARLAYARTTSVMSMVGYIVGLGDRHGENILFDSSCGDTVHVDLNCLFNKGETMEWPECVPFRLTRNMVHAMGPTGCEGIYRKACEVTMRVIRSQTDALMSVLRPFVHDPLVEWSRSARNSRAQTSHIGEIRNEMGLTHVKDIELRLNGIIKSKNKFHVLPLSIEGQVNYLIQEATDEKNLSLMYIGWTAYL